MKIYLFYLSFPVRSEFHTVFPNEDEEDAMYYLYPHLRRLVQTHDDKFNSRAYLYAITNKEELAYIFKEMHDMSLFHLVTHHCTKSEWKGLKTAYKEAVLTMEELNFKYIEGDTSSLNKDASAMELAKYCGYKDCLISIPITAEERSNLDDYFTGEIEPMLIDAAGCFDYRAFSDEYIKALDKLMYCFYSQMTGDDSDLVLYNMSYGITPEGYARTGSTVCSNEFVLYNRLYHVLLKKT